MQHLKNTAYTRLALATALIFGDGHLKRDKEMDLVVKHSMKQLDYLKYKCSLVNDLFHKDIMIHEHPEANYAEFHFRNPVFKRLKSKFYRSGRKSLDIGILNQLRHPLAWAIIYCDDGSLVRRYKTVDGLRRVNGRHLKIATHNFNYEEHCLMQKWILDNIGVFMHINRDRGYFHLRCGAQEAKKWCEYIKDYVPESMQYKLDFAYKCANPSENEVKIQSELTGNSKSTAEMPVPSVCL